MKKEFTEKGTWAALWAAKGWLKDNGYSYGSLDCNNPVAVVKGEYNLTQKWHNMTANDKKTIAGTIRGDFREGPVTVTIF